MVSVADGFPSFFKQASVKIPEKAAYAFALCNSIGLTGNPEALCRHLKTMGSTKALTAALLLLSLLICQVQARELPQTGALHPLMLCASRPAARPTWILVTTKKACKAGLPSGGAGRSPSLQLDIATDAASWDTTSVYHVLRSTFGLTKVISGQLTLHMTLQGPHVSYCKGRPLLLLLRAQPEL